MACESKTSLVWRQLGWCALVALTMAASCGGSTTKCDVECPAGTSVASSGCACAAAGDGAVMADEGQDSGLSCIDTDPIACGGADQPAPCDWATAQKAQTWCHNPPDAAIFVEHCAGGYSAIIIVRPNTGYTFYYQGNSIVADVLQPTAGPDVCTQGPAVFVPPNCGDSVALCPSVVDAGSE